MNTTRKVLSWIVRYFILYLLFIVFFIVGSMAVVGMMPDNAKSQPGLVSNAAGLFIIAFVNVSVIVALILASRWTGWRLAISLAFAYYGAVTFLMQIESWYFLSSITVTPEMLRRLFLMGIPPAFLFIPIAVWVLGKSRATEAFGPISSNAMPIRQWVWKLATAAVAYVVLYWGAGYFIAWQNPELRAFYGQPGEAVPFLQSIANTLRHDPLLFPFQIVRAMLWVLCALQVIRGSKLNAWWTALLVGLFFSVPQNIVHIIANPLMPLASVRLSHLMETASSTFIFGTIVVWLLHREHHSLGDLFGFKDSHGSNASKLAA